MSEASTQIISSADVAQVAFALKRLRAGYDPREVDEFLDTCASQLALPVNRRTLTAEAVSSMRFRTGRPGYAMADVDAFLDLVAGQLALDTNEPPAG